MKKFGLKAGTAITFLFWTSAVNAQVIQGTAADQPDETGTASASSPGNPEADSGLQEILVTAQKRSERLSDVPLSVTAVTGDTLARRGVTSALDLERVVPGFTYQPSNYGNPVFSVRGVGFFENALGVAPAVTVYVDQVPFPFLAMTTGVTLDLERIEALKGPQGTLFGQNSTGGALNYIAAKPTRDFQFGGSATYGRFNQFDVEGFISGPLSDTVSARLAVRSEQRGDWQRSYTRDDSLGERDMLTGRFLLDWDVSDRVRFQFNANGWRDRSDTQAVQFQLFRESTPVNGRLDARNAIGNYPVAPRDIRSADWDPNTKFDRDDTFYQLSVRGDFDMSDHTALTSITSYSDLDALAIIDGDGTNFKDANSLNGGRLKSLGQELRVSHEADRLKWVIGGNLQLDRTSEDSGFDALGSNQSLFGINFTGFSISNDQDVDTWAAFGGIDYEIVNNLTLSGSVRYTDQVRKFEGCLRDVGGGIAQAFSVLSTIVSGSPTTIPTGGCITLGPDGKPVLVRDSLSENNVSWKLGANWKPNPDLMIYANVSRGYKAGAFGSIPGINALQFTPITQESLLAYEAGFKLSGFQNRAQITSAVFYYDYTDKQIAGRTPVPLFGAVPSLVSIPESSVKGAELEISARPVDALRFSLGANYVDSKVKSNLTLPDPFGDDINVRNAQFPNTPKWQIIADAELSVPLNDRVKVYGGAGVKYRSASTAFFATDPLFDLPAYTLLDLRAGIESEAGWNAQLWARNVTNKRYLVTVYRSLDAVASMTGMPRTFGITIGYKYR